MPDVFKILKDLELKAVGLDPTTNKMQEGYFISFRSIGLPIHKEDFERPWSPLCGNLPQNLDKQAVSKPSRFLQLGSTSFKYFFHFEDSGPKSSDFAFLD
jgi:hypothetical protein